MSHSVPSKIRVAAIVPILVLLLLPPHPAVSCPICTGDGNRPPSYAEILMAAETIAVVSFKDGKSYEIWDVLRGDEELLGESIEDSSGYKQQRILAVRTMDPAKWRILGPFDSELRPLVQRCLPLSPLKAGLDEVWHARLDLFEKDLGHQDYRIGGSAWAVWATAPYRILASRTSAPSPETLRKLIAARQRPNEKALWWSLLGLYPSDQNRTFVRAGLEGALKKGSTENLAAMFSAHLAHDGEKAAKFISDRYLLDPSRSFEEVRAALLALGLHGTEIPDLRPGIQPVLVNFAKQRPRISGMVARDLMTWENWSLEKHYRTLMAKKTRMTPDNKKAIAEYLAACAKASNETKK